MTAPANVRFITPMMSPASESIKVWTVSVRCVQSKYCMGGRLVQPGDEHEMTLGDATDREKLGHLEIVSDPWLADSGVRLENIRREGRGWMTNF